MAELGIFFLIVLLLFFTYASFNKKQITNNHTGIKLKVLDCSPIFLSSNNRKIFKGIYSQFSELFVISTGMNGKLIHPLLTDIVLDIVFIDPDTLEPQCVILFSNNSWSSMLKLPEKTELISILNRLNLKFIEIPHENNSLTELNDYIYDHLFDSRVF